VRRRVAAHELATAEQSAKRHKAASAVFRMNGRPDLAEREQEFAAENLRTAAEHRAEAAAHRDQ
jgi:hypothetical protein